MLPAFPFVFPILMTFLFAQATWGSEGKNLISTALTGAIKMHIARSTSWKESEIEVRSIGNINGVELPSGDISFVIPQNNRPASYRNLVLPIEAFLNGKAIRTFWVTADIGIRARIVQAATRLPYGSMVSREDVRQAPTEIADPRAVYFRSPDEVIGQILRRTLSPGDPLTRECVTNPFLVRTGETVRLRMERGSVTLSAIARAEQNGRLGQVIRVRNPDFVRPVRALVTGRGEVRIE